MFNCQSLLLIVFCLMNVQISSKVKQSQWNAITLSEKYNQLNPVVDPNNILTQAEKDSLLNVILEIKTKKSVMTTIVFIDEMASTYAGTTYNGTKDIKRFVDEFASAIYKGNTNEQANSLIVLYSVKDRLVRISPGQAVGKFLSIAQQTKAIDDVKSYLRASKYGRAGIEGMNILLEGMVNPTSSVGFSKTAIALIIVAIVLSGILGGCLIFRYCCKRKDAPITNFSRDEKGEIKLYRIKKISQNPNKAKELCEESCIICLDNLVKFKNCGNQIPESAAIINDKELPLVTTTTTAHRPLIISLDCGHAFHRVCIKDWFELSKTQKCPTCRKETENINDFGHIKGLLEKSHETTTGTSQDNSHDSLIHSLVDIQLIMHPPLLTYVISFSDKGFDYSAPIAYYGSTAPYRTWYDDGGHGNNNNNNSSDPFFSSGLGGFSGGGFSSGGAAGVTGGW